MVRSMSTEPQHACPSCGNEFSGAMEFCPVCMLRKALAGGVESGESSASEDTVRPTTSEQGGQRFEHYELITGEDGKPVELGRGAMGVTYEWREDKRHLGVILRTVSVWCGAHLMTRFGKELIVFWAAFSSARFAAIGTQWDQIGGYST